MRERRGVYRVLVGKPEGKRPLGRPGRRWKDNIKADLQEVGCGGMDWIELAHVGDSCRALVNAVMILWVPKNAGNFLTSCKPVSFSRRVLLHGVSKKVNQLLKFILYFCIIFGSLEYHYLEDVSHNLQLEVCRLVTSNMRIIFSIRVGAFVCWT
jgi:hypothetical protein